MKHSSATYKLSGAARTREPLRFSPGVAGPWSMDAGADCFATPLTFNGAEDKLAQDAVLSPLMELAGGVPALLPSGSGGFMGAGSGFVGYPLLARLSQDGLVRAGVETVADDMTGRWIELRHTGSLVDEDADGEDDRVARLREASERCSLQALFNRAAQLCGYFGGCLAYIDMGPLSDDVLRAPLRLEPGMFCTRDFRGFRLVEPVNVSPGLYNANDPLAADFFRPRTWRVQGREIHRSRFLYFVDNEPPQMLRPAYNFFGIPQAQIALEYALSFSESRAEAMRLLQKFSTLIIKSNLSELLHGGPSDDVERRVRYMAQNRANTGVTLIDRETEDVAQLSTPLSGVTDMVRQALEFLAAIFRIPAVKFLGLTPGGLNATGENDMRNYHEYIAAQQEKQLREPLRHALDVLQMAEFGVVDRALRFSFVPLAQKDETARAQLAKLKADTAALYLNAGIISPLEARQALAQDPDGPYRALDPDKLPKKEQPAGGAAASAQGGGALRALPKGGPAGEPGPEAARKPLPAAGAAFGQDAAPGEKLVNGENGRWITTSNKQRVFINKKGSVVAGMGGKFTGKNITELASAEASAPKGGSQSPAPGSAGPNAAQNKAAGKAPAPLKGEEAERQEELVYTLPEQAKQQDTPLSQEQPLESQPLSEITPEQFLQEVAELLGPPDTPVFDLHDMKRTLKTVFYYAADPFALIRLWARETPTPDQTTVTSLGYSPEQINQIAQPTVKNFAAILERFGLDFETVTGMTEQEALTSMHVGMLAGPEAFELAAKHMPAEMGALLLDAAQTDLQQMELSAESLQALQEQLMASPLVQKMLAQDIALFSGWRRSIFLDNNLQTLAVYLHNGGDITALEEQAQWLVNDNILIHALKQAEEKEERQRLAAAQRELEQTQAKERQALERMRAERSTLEYTGHVAAVAGSGILTGIAEVLDIVSSIFRKPANYVAASTGYSGELFPPAAPAIAAGLAQPETDNERMLHSASRSAGSTLATMGVAKAAAIGIEGIQAAGTLANGGTKLATAHAVAQAMASNPGLQMTANAITDVAVNLVQRAGGDYVTQLAVGTALSCVSPTYVAKKAKSIAGKVTARKPAAPSSQAVEPPHSGSQAPAASKGQQTSATVSPTLPPEHIKAAYADAAACQRTTRQTQEAFDSLKKNPHNPYAKKLNVAASAEVNGVAVVEMPDGSLGFRSGNPGEQLYLSKNQNARQPTSKPDSNTAISNEAIEYGKDYYKGQNRSRFPNDTLNNSHAEIALMQHLSAAGKLAPGSSLRIPVVGLEVCAHCQKHIAWMAKKLKLQSVTVVEHSTGNVYYWRPGMNNIVQINE